MNKLSDKFSDLNNLITFVQLDSTLPTFKSKMKHLLKPNEFNQS